MAAEADVAGAVVTKGTESLTTATSVLLKFQLPPGLLALPNIEEFGYNEETGYMWMKQPNKSQQEFKTAEAVVLYAPKIHGYIRKSRIIKLGGVRAKDMKAKELFLSLPYDEIYVDDPPSGMIHFTNQTGNVKSYSLDAFET